LPRCRKDRIGNRRADEGDAGLAYTDWRLPALYDVSTYCRHFIVTQQREVVEVALYGGPVFDGDRTLQRRGQAEGNTALIPLCVP